MRKRKEQRRFFSSHSGQANFRLFEMHVADCLLIIKFVFSFGMWCLDLSHFYSKTFGARCAPSSGGSHHAMGHIQSQRAKDMSDLTFQCTFSLPLWMACLIWRQISEQIFDFSLGSTVWFVNKKKLVLKYLKIYFWSFLLTLGIEALSLEAIYVWKLSTSLDAATT